MESVLHLKEPMKKLADDHDEWAHRILNRVEWRLLEGVVKILKEFRITVKIWEVKSSPTMHRSLERVYHYVSILETFVRDPSNCQYGITFNKYLKKNVLKRFPVYGAESQRKCWANYLAPQYKGIHLLTVNKLEVTKDVLRNESNGFFGNEISI